VVLLSTAVFAVVLLWNTYRNRKRPIIPPPHVG
jgi:hypothetical protein